MSSFTRHVGIAVTFACEIALACAPAHAVIDVPDGFLAIEYGSGVPNPVGFDFLPDGRVLVITQKTSPLTGTGHIYLLVGQNVHGPVGVVTGVSDQELEEGLLGVAVDPGWPERPYLYVYFDHVSNHCYVRRYTASGALTNPNSSGLSFSSPYNILVDIPDQDPRHQGGTLRFGPDGMLYASLGDDFNSVCDLQDPSLWRGVVLRLDVSGLPASGTGPPAKSLLVPPGNPYAGPDDNARLTYSIGYRNPFRFTIDDESGNLYLGDVGSGDWEEVDEVQAGDNHGWPLREGAHDFPPGAGCPGDPGEDPIVEYPHSGLAAVVGGPRYRAQGGPWDFPVLYEGSVFYLDFYEGWLRRLVFDGLSWSPAPTVPGQANQTDWADGLEFVSDLQLGPDGALYFTRVAYQDLGLESFFGRIFPDPVVGVEPAATATPNVRVWPNPLRAGRPVTFTTSLGGGERHRLTIFGPGGSLVRVIPGEPGSTAITWDGADMRGTHVAPGTYFIRLEAGDAIETGRLSVIR